jgi:hypothetical protein
LSATPPGQAAPSGKREQEEEEEEEEEKEKIGEKIGARCCGQEANVGGGRGGQSGAKGEMAETECGREMSGKKTGKTEKKEISGGEEGKRQERERSESEGKEKGAERVGKGRGGKEKKEKNGKNGGDRIYAFEPVGRIYRVLRRNLQGICGVVPKPFGLAAQARKTEYFFLAPLFFREPFKKRVRCAIDHTFFKKRVRCAIALFFFKKKGSLRNRSYFLSDVLHPDLPGRKGKALC